MLFYLYKCDCYTCEPNTNKFYDVGNVYISVKYSIKFSLCNMLLASLKVQNHFLSLANTGIHIAY